MNEQTDSDLEEIFHQAWIEKYPNPIKLQYQFHPTRKFRFDFAFPSAKLAIEVMGFGAGHTSLPGMTRDYDKHIEALKLDWKVIYLTCLHLKPESINTTLRKVAYFLGYDEKPPTTYIPFHKRGPNARFDP